MRAPLSDDEAKTAMQMTSLNDALCEVLRGRGYRAQGAMTIDIVAGDAAGAVIVAQPHPSPSTEGADGWTGGYVARIHERWLLDDWTNGSIDGQSLNDPVNRTWARRTLLDKSLWALGEAPVLPLTAYLTGQAFPLDDLDHALGYRALFAAALDRWRADRVREGYTPEAAQVMLALLVPPHLAADLTGHLSG